MPDTWVDVDTAVAVPVNIMPLIDDTDFKSRETGITYNQAGMDVVWNFVTSAGVMTQTAVTPTTGGGDYDWTNVGDAMYKIGVPASGGASINNDTEGYGWFTGLCTGVLAWRSPVYGFRASGLNDLLTDSAFSATRGLAGTALPAAAADAAGGLPVSDVGGLDMDAKLANTNEVTVARMGALTDWINGGRLDLLLDAIPTTVMRGTDSAALASVCTEGRLAELDAGNLPTDVASVQTEVDKIGTIPALDGAAQEIGAALAKLADDNAGADFDATTDSLQAIRDRGDAAWTTGAGGSDRLLMVDTTIATLASQTSFTLTAGSADDKAYENCTIVVEDAATATQKAVGLVFAYTGSTKTVTLKYDPGVFTMAVTDKVYILAENALKSTDQNRQLDVTATGAAGIDWANVENPTTAVDLSATDIQLCDTTTTVTNTVNANAVSAIAAFFQDCFTVDSGEVSGSEVSGSLILEIAKVVWDRVLSGSTHNIVTSAGRRLRQVESIFVLDTGTAQAGASGSITLAAGANANDDFYLHTMIVITGGTGIRQVRAIQTYNGTTKVAETVPDWVVNPDATSTYEILADTLKHVFEIETGGILAASFATDAVDANALAADAVAEIAATIGPNVYGADCYYVDSGRADDTGDGLTWTAAKKTIGAAVGAASNGDLLLVGPGTYAEAVDASAKSYLRFRGAGNGTAISGNSEGLIAGTGFRGSHFAVTGSVEAFFSDVHDIQADHCKFTGGSIGFVCDGSNQVIIRHCHVTATVSGCELTTGDADESQTVIDCTLNVSGASSGNARGVNSTQGLNVVRNCKIYATSATNNVANYVAGVENSTSASTLLLIDCTIEVAATGDTVGAGLRVSNGVAYMYGGSIKTTGTTAYDLQQTGGTLYVKDVSYDKTKVSGTVIDLDERAVDDGLIGANLDHLAKTATASADMTTEVADNTILSRMLANGDTSAFTPSTDGLQPLRDQGDTAWITATGFATSGELATHDGKLDGLITTVGVAGAGLTDLGGMSTGMKGEVNAEADTALTDYDGPTNAEMEARTLVAASYATAAALATVDGIVDAILVDTGTTLPGLIASLNDPTAIQVADAVLIRAVENVEDTADRHSLGALIMIGTNSSVVSTTLTAKKPSNNATFQTYTLTIDASADPMTGIS